MSLFFSMSAFGQVYQLMPQYGYNAYRMNFDSTLSIPTVCGVPTLKSNLSKKSAIAYDTCNKRFYLYDAKLFTWDTIKGGNSIDTTSLSNRINQKIDSIKRSSDSVYSYKNGVRTFAYRDSIGYNDTAKVVVAYVTNAESTTLTRGEVVYLYQATGNRASVKRAFNKSDATSAKTFGIVKDDISANNSGYIVTQGQCDKLSLGSFTEGQTLYLDSIAGQMTASKPKAPYHLVYVGVVERANNGNGLLYVKPQNGYELDEIHDVQINTPLNNQIIAYSDTQSIWKNKNIYSVVDTTKLSARIDLRMKYTDSVSLSNRIDLKLNSADSSVYQTKYRTDTMRTNLYGNLLRKTDTLTLSGRIDLRVRYSDTASMLTNYAKSSAVNLKLNISDTSSMLTNYAKTSAVNLKLNISDTSNMLSNYYRRTDTLLSTKFRVNYSASTTDFPVIIKNTNASAVQSNVLSFDCSATGADQPVFVNLASTNAKGMVFFASNQATSSSPAGAGFQIYSTSSTNFPGQMYFDGGAHNSSSLIFRTAQTSGTITQRMRVFAGGNVQIGGSGTDAGYKLDCTGTLRATQFYLSSLNTAPASATATGTTGEIRIDASYIYICTATNTWKRVAIATW